MHSPFSPSPGPVPPFSQAARQITLNFHSWGHKKEGEQDPFTAKDEHGKHCTAVKLTHHLSALSVSSEMSSRLTKLTKSRALHLFGKKVAPNVVPNGHSPTCSNKTCWTLQAPQKVSWQVMTRGKVMLGGGGVPWYPYSARPPCDHSKRYEQVPWGPTLLSNFLGHPNQSSCSNFQEKKAKKAWHGGKKHFLKYHLTTRMLRIKKACGPYKCLQLQLSFSENPRWLPNCMTYIVPDTLACGGQQDYFTM